MEWLVGVAIVVLGVVMFVAGVYTWAQANTDTTQAARVIAWLEADVVVARFGRSYGELDHIGWPALFDDLVAALPEPG